MEAAPLAKICALIDGQVAIACDVAAGSAERKPLSTHDFTIDDLAIPSARPQTCECSDRSDRTESADTPFSEWGVHEGRGQHVSCELEYRCRTCTVHPRTGATAC